MNQNSLPSRWYEALGRLLCLCVDVIATVQTGLCDESYLAMFEKTRLELNETLEKNLEKLRKEHGQ